METKVEVKMDTKMEAQMQNIIRELLQSDVKIDPKDKGAVHKVVEAVFRARTLEEEASKGKAVSEPKEGGKSGEGSSALKTAEIASAVINNSSSKPGTSGQPYVSTSSAAKKALGATNAGIKKMLEKKAKRAEANRISAQKSSMFRTQLVKTLEHHFTKLKDEIAVLHSMLDIAERHHFLQKQTNTHFRKQIYDSLGPHFVPEATGVDPGLLKRQADPSSSALEAAAAARMPPHLPPQLQAQLANPNIEQSLKLLMENSGKSEEALRQVLLNAVNQRNAAAAHSKEMPSTASQFQALAQNMSSPMNLDFLTNRNNSSQESLLLAPKLDQKSGSPAGLNPIATQQMLRYLQAEKYQEIQDNLQSVRQQMNTLRTVPKPLFPGQPVAAPGGLNIDPGNNTAQTLALQMQLNQFLQKQEQAEAEKANKSKNNNLTSLKAPQQQWLADYLKKMNGDMLSKENGRAQEAKPMGLDPANALNQISLLNSMNGGLPQNKPLNLPLEQTGQSASQNQAQMKVPVSYNLLLKLFQNAVQGNNKDDKK